jgi:hypothetical protein
MPAETARVSTESAEAKFFSVDPETGIQTFVAVYAALSGPNDEPHAIVEVSQTNASGFLIFSGSYADDDIVPEFTMKGPHVISAHLAGTVRMDVQTPETLSTTATFDFTFQAAGPTVHDVTTDQQVIPGESVQVFQDNSFRREATATGTLTIEEGAAPGPAQYSTANAELLWSSANDIQLDVLPGADNPDWML